jgi:hypothetical protein
VVGTDALKKHLCMYYMLHKVEVTGSSLVTVPAWRIAQRPKFAMSEFIMYLYMADKKLNTFITEYIFSRVL